MANARSQSKNARVQRIGRRPPAAVQQAVAQPDRSPVILLIVLGFFYFLPLYWMVVNALKSNDGTGVYPPTWYPHHLEWSNFQRAVDVFPFWTFLKNTTIITVLTVIGVALTTPMVAYGFSRIQWPGRDKVFYWCWRRSSSHSRP